MADGAGQNGDGAGVRDEPRRPNAAARALRQPIVAGLIVTVVGSSIVALLTGDLGGGGEAETGSPRLTAIVEPDLDRNADEWNLLLPGPLPPGAPDADCAAARDWLLDHDAVDAYATYLTVHLETTGARPVTVTGARLDVVERGPLPADGTLARCPPPLGPVPVVSMNFDLDDDAPRAVDGNPYAAHDAYFSTHTVRVPSGRPVTLKVAAFVRKCACQWRLVLETAAAGQAGELVIDDHGKPFLTSGSPTGDPEQYEWGSLRCMPDLPAPCRAA